MVVIDEFYGWIARDLMCRICDRYPLNIETKGGSVSFLAKKIIITSNVHPKDWWPKVGLGAMERRLKAPLGRIEFMPIPWRGSAPAVPVDSSIAESPPERISPLAAIEAPIPASPLTPVQEEQAYMVASSAEIWNDEDIIQVNRIGYGDWD